MPLSACNVVVLCGGGDDWLEDELFVTVDEKVDNWLMVEMPLLEELLLLLLEGGGLLEDIGDVADD